MSLARRLKIISSILSLFSARAFGNLYKFISLDLIFKSHSNCSVFSNFNTNRICF